MQSTVVEVWTLFVWLHLKTSRTYIQLQSLSEIELRKKHIFIPPPELKIVAPSEQHKHFQEGFTAVNKGLFGNLRNSSPLSEYRYASPSPAFAGIYLWDSAFISQIWRWWDRTTAIDILLAVIAQRDGDRLQHAVKAYGSSRLTQPPLIAWSLAEIAKERWDETVQATVKEAYPALVKYNAWLCKNRRLQNGLFAWAKPYESGIDNSPRFSNRAESKTQPTTALASPDFSTYMVLDSEALATLADQLGHKKESSTYHKQAAAIRTAMNTYLWHDKDGLYYDHSIDGTWIRSRTITSLIPLWAGIPTARQARRLCQHAIAPESFGTLIPLPSVALDDPDFELDMWRGPVWINTAYAVLIGLRRYGFTQETSELAWRLVNGVYSVFKTEGTIYEFYDPRSYSVSQLSRKRGNYLKRLTLGSGPQRHFVGWSGLANSIVVEILFGFQICNGQRTLRPAFPDAAIGVSFRLNLPQEKLTIELTVDEDRRTHGTFRHGSKSRKHEFTTQFGEVVLIDD